MLRRRTRLPVLAEISGPAEGSRAWSLRRGDFESLEGALGRLEGQRVLLIGGRREAAPVAAIALAAAAAAGGRRTILVECDLGQPQLAAYVGLAAAPGLHEYLRWEAEPADVLQPVVLGGSAADGSADPLACVCGGRPASKTETLLNLQSFAEMVEKLRAAYELVLLSGPPPVEEPGPCLAAARQADAVVAGVPASATGDRALGKVIKRLPIPALGSIAIGD
jgi:MinD-like ATPase involved in chromosome partitioning or flagellar assembly